MKDHRVRHTIYFFLSFVFPIVSCLFILGNHLIESGKRQEITKKIVEQQALHSLALTLRSVENEALNIASSEDLMNYFNSKGNIKYTLENRLIGRMDHVASLIDSWTVSDHLNRTILDIGISVDFDKISTTSGFLLVEDQSILVLNIPIRVNYNNFIVKKGDHLGTLSVAVSIEKILERNTSVQKLIQIPRSPDDGNFVVDLKDTISQPDEMMLEIALLILFIVLISATSCFWIFKDQRKEEVLANLGKVSQMIAHDLRKPFTQVKGISQLLSFVNDTEKIKIFEKYLPQVNRSLLQVDKLLDEVLYSELDQIVVDSKSDLLCTIQKIALNSCYKDKPIDLDIFLSHTGFALVDSKILYRILDNIISNALDIMNSGTVYIATKSHRYKCQNQILISIENTGSSLEKKEIKKIFEPFYTKKDTGGIGLGLSIVKKLVEAAGGYVLCKSTVPDKVLFEVSIPSDGVDCKKYQYKGLFAQFTQKVDPDCKASKPREPQRFSSENPCSILILDDELLYIDALYTQILNSEVSHCIKLYSATNYKDAESLFTMVNPDLVIVDYDLNASQNGISAIRSLREISDSSVFYLHSNRSESTLGRDYISCGAKGLVSKPMTSKDFIKIISPVIDL